MEKACIVVSPFYQKNRLFDLNDTVSNKDNCLYGFYLLKERFRDYQIDLSTQDINPVNDSGIVLFNDMPKMIPKKKISQKFGLLALESIAVLPGNFNARRYRLFDKVFTWHDGFVDNNKIIKINYSFLVKPDPFINPDGRKKLICLISNNKFSSHQYELYSERIEAIDFFEKTHPNDFDLFGIGWNHAYRDKGIYSIVQQFQKNKMSRFIWQKAEVILKSTRIINTLTKRYETYQGPLSPKIPSLRYYKFNLCYENVANVPGYITEKIFDCFFAGCVPVYLGAPNVTDYIPADTFIDKRNFKTYEELYRYMKDMSNNEYEQYLENIRDFISSDKMYPFSAECFADTIIKHILETG